MAKTTTHFNVQLLQILDCLYYIVGGFWHNWLKTVDLYTNHQFAFCPYAAGNYQALTSVCLVLSLSLLLVHGYVDGFSNRYLWSEGVLRPEL